jgi:hypothetical protein
MLLLSGSFLIIMGPDVLPRAIETFEDSEVGVQSFKLGYKLLQEEGHVGSGVMAVFAARVCHGVVCIRTSARCEFHTDLIREDKLLG